MERMKKKKVIIPIFVPHIGCPHTCIFCNQRKIAGDFSLPTKESVKNQVLEYQETIERLNTHVEIAFYGGSFTAIDKELQEDLLSIAREMKEKKYIDAIRLSTRPDYINERVLERLKKYGVDTIELGVQSLDDEVLFFNERCHTEEDVYKAVSLIKESPFNLGIQIMPGLYKDSFEKALETAQKVILLEPDFVRIYPTVIIKETKLFELYKAGEFIPWSLEEAIEISSLIYILFVKKSIKVIRTGLQATDALNLDRDLKGGPYHPSFGELVKARVLRKLLEKEISKNLDDLERIEVNYRQLSKFKGQKRCNEEYFLEKFKKTILISPEKNLAKNKLRFVFSTGTCKNYDLEYLLKEFSF